MSAAIHPEMLPRIAPHFRFQWEPAQETYVILYPEGMVKLNPSAGEILKRCDGSTSVAGIIADLSTQFPGVPLAAEVYKFLEQARNNGWLDIR